jgi:hypothetical protein
MRWNCTLLQLSAYEQRFLLADDVGLVARDLVVDQDAVLDDVPALRLHAFVVVADRAERTRRVLVGDDVHQR